MIMTKKILMVLTSHDELGNTGQKTGFWVEEFAAPYYAFIDAGVEVTLASPKGGQAPIDACDDNSCLYICLHHTRKRGEHNGK